MLGVISSQVPMMYKFGVVEEYGLKQQNANVFVSYIFGWLGRYGYR